MTSADALLQDLPAAVAHWRQSDPVLAGLAESHAIEPWDADTDDPFVALCTSIIHQQVSLAAGRTIYGRFRKAVGTVAPEAVVAAGEERLRAAGLSRQKCGYILDLAAKCADGDLDLTRVADLDDEPAILALTQVKGIGAWSAKMFLLFHLGRPDVCPHEDLGVRLAVQQFYGVAEKEAAAWLQQQCTIWSPYNSLAARVLWNARDR